MGENLDEPFITIEGVMHELGISRRTVFYLVQRGKLTKFKTSVGRGRGGRRTFFSVAQVRRLARPVPFDPSTATPEQIRALNEQFERVQQEWLAKQKYDPDLSSVLGSDFNASQPAARGRYHEPRS